MAEQDKMEIADQPIRQNAIVDYLNLEDRTLYQSPWVPESYEQPYNSDKIYKKTGNYSIYETMLDDDQVSICTRIKKDLILGSGFDIMSTGEEQEEQIEFFTEMFGSNCPFPFNDRIEEVMTAYDFGFSLTEKVFAIENNQAYLKELITRHPASWLMYQDPKGLVTKYEQQTRNGRLDIKKESLIHYINYPKFQNPYGRSDLRSCYDAYFIKREIVKYFAIYMEKAAAPLPIARYDKNAPKQAIDDLYSVIKRLQARTAMVIPKDIEMEYLQANSSGEAYHKAIGIFNMMIGRALFIPDLMGFSGAETGGGSYSLGKEQMAVFFMHINRRRKALETIINQQIVAPIGLYNWGFMKMPEFKFKPIDDMQAVEMAKVWLEAVKGHVYEATPEEINHFRKLVKFPIQDLEEMQLEDEASEELDDKEKEETEETENEDADPQNKEEPEKKEFMSKLPKGSYHKKVDFKAIETKLKDYDQSILDESKPIVKKMLKDLFAQIERRGILRTQNAEKIEGLKLKFLPELRKVFLKSFNAIYKDGQISAAKEIEKGNYKSPLPNKKFMDVLEQETWDYVGDYEYMILKNTRIELIKAIKDGMPLSEVEDILSNMGETLSETSIERYARTKHTEVMNRGRKEYWESSGVIAAYQYSAILDNVTTEICEGLNGKIFAAGTEPTPPLHFNCRSLLIPITKYEEWEADETVGKMDIQDFIEEKKGAGFATN